MQSVSLVLTVLALLLVLGGITFFWKHPNSPERRWRWLLAIVVLPVLSLYTGTQANIEHAQKLEFCYSCHVMTPFSDDLQNPDSESLASIHYQNRYILNNQCYTCHTDYTMFGPIEAKIGGMRHLWNYATNGYEHPIKLRGEYNFGNCLQCHGEAKNFIESHDEETRESIKMGDMTCLMCHGPAHAVGGEE